ncbi:MAG: hypothetical protein GTO02_04350, partial [Candidatus Dadabacteria bacterium]|nr:hypothetical protein [Candidatus Dadabacteria bacterium]
MGNAIQKIFRLLKPSVPKKEGADGHHFSHTFQRLKVLCDLGFKPDSICDIGASDGRWSRKCQRVFPEARYFCVDPLDENLSHLAKFSSENSQVSYWHGCLGSRAGTLTMNMDGTGSSILPGHTGNLYGVQ